MRALSKLEQPAYTLLRIVAGFMFTFHGLQKLFGWLTERATPDVFSQKWFGGAIELVCGVLICVGLGTRLAAFLSSGTMAVAYFQFHQPQGVWPIQNHGEPAVLFCFIFLALAAHGAGKWSVDGWWRGRGRR